MEKNIKWAILDLDDTLYDYNHSNEKGTEAVLDFAEKELNNQKFQEQIKEEKDQEKEKNTDTIKELTKKLEASDQDTEKDENAPTTSKKITREEIKSAIAKGRKETNEAMPTQWSWHSRLLYFQKALEQLTGKTNFELTLEMEKVFWDSFIEHMKVYDWALELLKKLKQKNRKVTILTDLTAQVQHKKIIKLLWGNQHYVDYLVSSEEVGTEKPSPEGFELSMRKMGIEDKDEVCMIGDNYKKDILWAKNFWITKLYHKVNENKENQTEEMEDGVTHFKFFSEIEGDF